MKYVILRRRVKLEEDPFEVIVGARDQTDVPPAFRVDAEDLSDQDLGDLRRDPSVIDLIPSIPLSLIQPFDEPVPEKHSPGNAWGVEAVGGLFGFPGPLGEVGEVHELGEQRAELRPTVDRDAQ